MEIIIFVKSIIWNLFELDVEKSSSKNNQIRFEYLDGYRGSLVVVVGVNHMLSRVICYLFYPIRGYSQTYAVTGFFMLSAFLLTYRLLEDLDRVELNNAKNYPLIFLPVFKYSIRRFFRIYLVYVLFSASVKFGPAWLSTHDYFKYESSFLEMITLGNPGFNHLWTIPSEIRYYFVIPLFCLIVYFLKQYRVYILALCIAWTIYDQFFNFFDLTVDQIDFDYKDSHRLYPHFAVFLLGSEVALAYHIVTKNESIMRWIRHPRVQLALDASSLLIAIFGLAHNWSLYLEGSDFACRSRAALYWSSALFFTLLGETPNTIASYFASSRTLKSIGKFSFSFYLLHIAIGRYITTFSSLSELTIQALAFICSFIVSFFTFYLIENPLIRFANFLCKSLDKHFDKYQSLSNSNN